MEQMQRGQIFMDNQGTISIASDSLFHGKTKHINIKFFFIRDIRLNAYH